MLQGKISYNQNLEKISNYSTQNLFIENKGQEHTDIKFKLKQGSSTLILREDGYSYHLMDNEKYSQIIKNKHDGIENEDLTIQYHLVHQTFLNTLKPTITARKKTNTITNYIHGNDSTKWGLNILPAKEVYYDELYRGIDLRYLSTNENIKYELIVEPYVKTNQISFEYKGQDNIFIDEFGRLIIQTSLGNITEDPPYVYQKINGKVVEIKSAYKLKKGVLSYKIGAYDKGQPLIIDPNLVFSTYSGSDVDNWGNTACHDTDGNLYAGSTVFPNYSFLSSDKFVFSSGAYQKSFQGGNVDMGIIKFNSTGTDAFYATYYGGEGSEIPLSMITDDNNDLYIFGSTSSRDLSVSSNAYKNYHSGGNHLDVEGSYSFIGGTDIYLTKLNDKGHPIKSTYFGGTGNEGIAEVNTLLNLNYKNQLRGDLAIDHNGDIILSSYTTSHNIGKNSFNNTKNNQADGIVAKFNADLSDLKWCGYIGGSYSDALYSLDINSDNDIYTCGTTVNASTYSTNAFVTKISSDGQTIMALEVFGTNNLDEAYFVRTGSDGKVYVTGQTEGTYPIYNANFNVPNGGNFIHCFSPDLSQTIFSTSFGIPNKANLVPSALMIDDCNRIYFTGWANNYTNYRNTGIEGLRTTPDAIKKNSRGYDLYFMVLEEGAQNLSYGTYFGGDLTQEHLDGGMSRFDSKGIVYQCVCTGCNVYCNDGDCNFSASQNYPLYPKSFNTIFPRQKGNGLCNSAVFKFDLSNASAKIDIDGICQNDTVLFRNNSFGATNFTWDLGDGTIINTTEAEDIIHTFSSSGTHTIILTAESVTQCNTLLKDSVTIFVSSKGDEQNFTYSTCVPETYKTDLYTDTSSFTYEWINASSKEIDNSKIANPTLSLTGSKDYFVQITDVFGCSKTDVFSVTIPEIIPRVTFINEPSCSQETLGRLRFENDTQTKGTKSNPAYSWTINGEFTSTKTPNTMSFTEPDSVHISLNITLDACSYDTSFATAFTETYYPNIITPNGDGKNDVYKIKGIENGQWKLSITNRWGKEVFKSEDYNNDFGAENLREGTYYYLIISPDNTHCKGWLQIVK